MKKETSLIISEKIPQVGEVSSDLENKIEVLANLILDRIADDLKNNCLKIPLKN